MRRNKIFKYKLAKYLVTAKKRKNNSDIEFMNILQFNI